MKKRFFALLLAVMMIVAATASVASAGDHAEITPRYRPCPLCQVGIIYSTLIDSRDVYIGRAKCPCYYPDYPSDAWKYNCEKYEIRNTYQDICNNPKCNMDYGDPVTRSGGYRWVHDACIGSGCGH